MSYWQLGKTPLKYLRYLRNTLVVFVVLYFLPSLVLLLPSMQRRAGVWVSTALSDVLGERVSIDRVDISLWHRLEVEGFSLVDRQADTILRTNRLLLGLSPLKSLSTGCIYIGATQLFGAKLTLKEDTKLGRLNITPILERLSSGDEPSSLVLDIGTIVLRDADIHYWRDAEEVLSIKKLGVRLGQINIAPEGYSLILDELQAQTSSGFELRKLSAELSGTPIGLRLSKVRLNLTNSEVEIPLLSLATSERGINLLDTLIVDKVRLEPKDLEPLLPQALQHIPSTPLEGTISLVRHSKQELSGSITLLQSGALHLVSRAKVHSTQGGDILEAIVYSDSLNIKKPWLSALTHLATPKTANALGFVERLGQVTYNGRAEYSRVKSRIDIAGTLSSAQGQIVTQASAGFTPSGTLNQISAKISTPQFALSSLLSSPITSLQTEADIKAIYTTEHKAWDISATINLPEIATHRYTFRGLQIGVQTDRPGVYSTKFTSLDPNALLSGRVSGQYISGQLSDIAFQLDIDGINLGHLGLEPLELNRHFFTHLNGSLSSLDLNKAQATLSVPVFGMIQGQDTLLLDDIELSLEHRGEERQLSLTTPWSRFSLNGLYTPMELPERVLHSIYRHIPILRNIAPKHHRNRSDSDALLSLHIDSLPRHLDKLVPLPLKLHRPLDLTAGYDEVEDRMFISLGADSLDIAQRQISNLDLTLIDKQLNISGNATLFAGGVLHGFRVSLATDRDDLRLSCDLGRDESGLENGIINLDAHLRGLKEHVGRLSDIQADLELYPSRLRIHSALWELSPAKLSINAHRFAVNGLHLRTQGRSLGLDGALGSPLDELTATLENISLRYILESAGVNFTMLETDLTGQAKARVHEGVLYADAHVTSPHFHVNGRDAAAINIGLDWNSRDMDLNLKGFVHQDSIRGRANVAGHIKLDSPAGIDLTFDADSLGIGFVHTFTSDFLSSLDGAATGQIRLFGRFEHGVTLEGSADIKHGHFGLGIIGTEYTLEDKIHFTPDRIIFDRIRLTDREQGVALLNGYVGHDHFSRFDIQLRADSIDHLCVLRTHDNRNLPVYGLAYASGKASLSGNDSYLELKLDVRGEHRTDVTLDFNTVQVGKQEGVMRFKRLGSSHVDSTSTIEPESLPVGIGMKLNIEVTPAAKVGMLLGYDASGGELRGRAMGHLSIHVPELGESSVYGNLDIIEGLYTIRLEQLAQKRFGIAEGGEITFRGQIDNTEMDLKAIYALTANIADLDEDLVFDTRRTNIPVHCILELSGSVVRPSVQFSIELPGADTELERRVRSLLNTDDAVMRQMLYLIALGKFYTLDSFSRSRQSAVNNLTSVASSALSEQLSYLLGGLSDSFNIGTNIKTRSAAFDDTDVELLLSGSLFDNRLLLSANVGYHDNPYLNSTYIGEFDLEYKLNRSGSLRLKGYNHYNHMYQYLRQGLTTQGLGILFRQRFERFSDLFAPNKWSLFPSKKRLPKNIQLEVPQDSLQTATQAQ